MRSSNKYSAEFRARTVLSGVRWQLGIDAVCGLESARHENGDNGTNEVGLRAVGRG